MKKTELLIVTGKDRPGIISKVTEVLFRYRCNLEDISMTILEGTLVMSLVVSYEAGLRKSMARGLAPLENSTGLSFFWAPLGGPLKRGAAGAGKNLFLITAIGKDRTGIVHRVSQVVAKKGLNITDLNSRILGAGKQSLYALALEVESSRGVSESSLKRSFSDLAKRLEVEIQIKPVEHLQF